MKIEVAFDVARRVNAFHRKFHPVSYHPVEERRFQKIDDMADRIRRENAQGDPGVGSSHQG